MSWSQSARRSAGVLALAAGLLAARPVRAADPPPAGGTDAEVVFTDGSTLKLKVLDDALDLSTPYGPLKVPLARVRRIDFGLRVTDDEAKGIAAAVADVADPKGDKRAAGREALKPFGVKAVPALRRALDKADGDAAAALDEALKELSKGVEDPADLRDTDVVVTDDIQLAGRLAGTTVRVMTTQFGEQKLKLDGVRSVYGPGGAPAEEPGDVEDAPPAMSAFQNRFGQTVRLRVTATAAGQNGTIYGTGTYTMDSHFPTAVVHAGALKPGQTGVVRVRIVPSPPQFASTTQNGITSNPWGPYQPGAFEIVVDRKKK